MRFGVRVGAVVLEQGSAMSPCDRQLIKPENFLNGQVAVGLSRS